MRRIACLLIAVAGMPAPLCGAGSGALAERLPNAIRVHERVLCGGQPAGWAGFAALRRLGVKTVISVDGAAPDVDNARRFGLRYVHLPHGYDGIPDSRLKELAKAVRDLEGPVYVHCHHGLHRSPAAAAAACVAAGLIPKEAAVDLLALAGTSRDYRGLHDVVRGARPIDPAELDALVVEFRESVPAPPLAEAMVALERSHDRLKLLAEAGWRSPAGPPQRDPPHEALLMREHFTEVLRLDEAKRRGPGFLRIAERSLADAERLEQTLRAGDATPSRHDEANRLLHQITQQCAACHQQHRDAAE